MTVFDLHHPLTFTFGVLGNLVSILVFLAPVPTFIRIHREKSTMGYQALPYVVALFSSMLWMYYAFIKKDALLLISINSFGCFIEIIYLAIFLSYASEKAKKHTFRLISLLDGVLFATIYLFSFFVFKGETRVQAIGWICVIVSVCVFAAPLSIMFQVIRSKSVEFMPFPLSFFLTLSAILWFAYGAQLKDTYIAFPNVLGFILGVLQMLLYGIYRNSKAGPVIEEKKLPEHVTNISNLGNTHDSKTCGNANDEKAHVEEDKRKEESVAIDVETEVPCRSQVNVKLESPVLVVCTA